MHNYVQRGGVCIKHGAKTECKHNGCKNHVVKGGVCIRHGAKVKLCSNTGCTNQAQRGGVCIRQEQRQSANTRDAPIMRSREECASGMGQRSNDALIQNALIRIRGEDFASSMGQHGQRNDAAEEVAPIMLKEEECASGMSIPQSSQRIYCCLMILNLFILLLPSR
jgi:hypothetical protein